MGLNQKAQINIYRGEEKITSHITGDNASIMALLVLVVKHTASIVGESPRWVVRTIDELLEEVGEKYENSGSETTERDVHCRGRRTRVERHLEETDN